MADIYFDVYGLTKDGIPYPLNVTKEELIRKGYGLEFEGICVRPVRTITESDDLLRDIARGKGKGIICKLLCDGLIK